MKTGKSIFHLIGTTLMCVATITVAGCGGGGGGGSNALPYSGKTTPVEITAENNADIAVEIMDAAMEAGDIGELAPLFKQASSEEGISHSPWIISLANLVKSRFTKNNDSSASGKLSVGAEYSETIDGSCGGTMTMSMSGSETNASGSMIAVNYCEHDYIEQVTMNGTVSFSMTAALDAYGELNRMTMTMDFSSYNVSETGGANVTIDGSATTVMDASMNITMTLNIASIDNVTNITFKMENYVMTLDLFGSSVSVSGRIYHSDYGYVDIRTPTPLSIAGDMPASGVIVLAGADNATITVTFSVAGYTIEADYDGNAGVDATTCFDSFDNETSCPL